MKIHGDFVCSRRARGGVAYEKEGLLMKNMKKLFAAVLFCGVLLSGSAFAADKVYKIKIGNTTAADHPLNVCLEKIAQLMR